MKNVISATTLARQLGDILGRVRYRRETFLIERNGVTVAQLVPAGETPRATSLAALRSWREAAPREPEFADDLERVGAADRAPDNPWGS
jgi:antitoxin (DNA-binding transcriptional repressor) of toxin-antitoxin stability system